MGAIHELFHLLSSVKSDSIYKSKGAFTRKTKLELLLFSAIMSFTPLHAQLDLGSDVVSRYIWRGTDFGNSVSIQPYISYSSGGFEAGAWSSWAVTSAGANEHDLYVSYSGDLVGVTLTDYYFPVEAGAPGSDVFNFNSEDGSHILEIAGSVGAGPLTATAAVNFLGDPENSVYLEGTYLIFSEENLSADITIGAGNAIYVSSEDTGFNAVSMALNVTKGSYMASYILNPEARISWLVFGVNF